MVRFGRGQVWGRCACGGMRQAYEEVFDGESVFGVVCCGVAMICCPLPFEVHVPCVCASACVLCVSVRTSASLILKITPPRTHGDLIFSSLSNVHVLNESTKRRRHSNTTPGFWRAAVGVGGRERHGGTGTGTAETGPRRADEQARRKGERRKAAGGGRQERSAVTGGRRREWRTTVSTRVLRDHGERTNVDRRAATGLVMPTSWRCIARGRGQRVYWHSVTV